MFTPGELEVVGSVESDMHADFGAPGIAGPWDSDPLSAKEADRLSTIRMLLAAMKQKEVDERVTLDDAMVVAIVDKLIKQRKDSITAFQQAGRTDLADKEAAEVKVLEGYLPQRLSADEITAAVNAIVAELGASGPGDMGKVMGAVKAKLAGKADMSLVSAAVKQALAK